MRVERFIWTDHAELRLGQRGLARFEVEEAVREGHEARVANRGDADWRVEAVRGGGRRFVVIYENGPQYATPLYYGPHLHRFPAKSAEVVAAIARARPGGVAFHCAGGRDRSGQVAILVLALVGVAREQVVADYLLSHEHLPALYSARGEEDQGPALRAFLRESGTSAEAEIQRLLEIDLKAVLATGGLTEADLAALRRRLLARSDD